MKSIRKAMTNMRRTPYQSLAAILVLTNTFFVGIVISFASISVYQALKYFETRPQVLIFFEVDTPEASVTDLQNELRQNPEVSEVTYVPQDEALAIYQDLNQNDPLLLELVTADILPPSLEISTINIEALSEIAEVSRTSPGVEEVAFRQDIADLLSKWLKGIEFIGLAFVGLMIFTSVLIVMVIVGMKISSKHHEVKILRLIGASSWYIQGPYLLEGALYGLLSSILAFVLALSLVLYSTPVILDFAGEIPLLPTSIEIILGILAGAVGVGIIIGTFGSSIAIKRFLKL